MNTYVETSINASVDTVWRLITDIENSANVISAIQKLEVLEKPEAGLVGFKWKETRKMFGKEATEVMWVTDVKERESYTVRAESHGAVYTTVMSIREENGQVVLGWDFGAEVQTMGARIMWTLTGWMAKSSMKKGLEQDLADLKKEAEQR